jgi:NADPH2:quinone reductase
VKFGRWRAWACALLSIGCGRVQLGVEKHLEPPGPDAEIDPGHSTPGHSPPPDGGERAPPDATMRDAATLTDAAMTDGGAEDDAGRAVLEGDASGALHAMSLSAGMAHTCATLESGEIVCWGLNDVGQLGDGTTTSRSTPRYVPGITDAVEVAAGGLMTCARRANGQVLCWGYRGLVGDGTIVDRSSPVPVIGVVDAVQISCGYSSTCAVSSTGTVSCWGDNLSGILGDGTSTPRALPVAVPGLKHVTTLHVGIAHTCAVVDGGGVYCWGANFLGQIGANPADNQPLPIAVAGLTATKRVVAGAFHTCALDVEGRVRCLGDNEESELGQQSLEKSSRPLTVAGLGEILGLSTKGTFTVAVSSDLRAEGGEVLVHVRAATLKPIDRALAGGKHYASPAALPVVCGLDGVGVLDDGQRVYFSGTRAPYGGMAERTVVRTSQCVPLDPAIDDASAAALFNPGMAAWLPLTWRAQLAPGETVLVLGATGVAGRLAVRAARLLGAGRIVAAGRDAASLEATLSLGADATIRLDTSPEELEAAFVREGEADGLPVIIDYLWGKPIEALLRALKKLGNREDRPIRLVHVGEAAGPTISLPGSILRGVDFTLTGFGLRAGGVLAPRDIQDAAYRALVRHAARGELGVDVVRAPLADVASHWNAKELRGVRTVVIVREPA